MQLARSTKSLISIAVVVSLAMCAGGFSLWRDKGVLAVDESTCNLGRVWNGSRLRWKVRVKNSTNCEFVIADIQTSCACAVAQSAGLVIPPGQDVEIPVDINTGAATSGEAKYEQPFSSSLRIIFAHGLKPLVVELRGTILTPAVVDWDTVRLGRVFDEDKSKFVNVIALTPLTSISEVKIEPTSEGRYVLRLGSLKQSRHSVPIEMSLGQALSPGIIDDRIRLICTVDSERDVKGDPFLIELRVSGEIVGDLVSNLSAIDFGLYRGPGTLAKEVEFASRSGRKFRLQFEGDKSPGVKVSNELDQLASSHLVELVLDCGSPGSVKRGAEFTAIYDDGSRAGIDVPVIGYVTFAIPVPLSASPVKLNMP